MFVRDMKLVGLFLAPTIVFLYFLLAFFHGGPGSVALFPSSSSSSKGLASSPKTTTSSKPPTFSTPPLSAIPLPPSTSAQAGNHAPPPPPRPHKAIPPAPPTHNELLSLTTPSKSYFTISLGPSQPGAINPNIIPHPTVDNLYAIIAVEESRGDGNYHELACWATFTTNSSSSSSPILSCLEPPQFLPIAPTKGLECTGKFGPLNFNSGPHDARVFWGPEGIYTIYGSNSAYGCFGQFMQSFPELMDWTEDMLVSPEPPGQRKKSWWPLWTSQPVMATSQERGRELFPTQTELRRPGPHGTIEKNWFVFWDRRGEMYVHYDILPRRSFARIFANGSTVAPGDIAYRSVIRDAVCQRRYMPRLGSRAETIHQATNSLAVTLCDRSDPACVPDGENTVVLTVFQKKTCRFYRCVYEPYVMAFNQTAPFEVYGIGTKPLWIRGREGDRNDGTGRTVSEMVFVTSIAWKGRGMRYAGYLDDELFLGFGVEDKRSGGIDVRAADLLRDLGLCEGL